MYNSVSLPVEDENAALVNSHREGSFERTLWRHKVKAGVAILFVVVVALVGLSNNKTASPQVPSSSAYIEAEEDVIDPGVTVLTEVAVQGVDSGAYMTHSANGWHIISNIGIFGAPVMSREEQWDIHYLNDQYGQYYKLIHSHDDPPFHWLTMQGSAPSSGADYNPSVLQGQNTIYDKEGFLRWNLARNADGSDTVTDTPALNTEYYLVNRIRDRCLAIVAGVANPNDPNMEFELQQSVTSFAKDGSGNFPSSCKVRLLDASNIAPPPKQRFANYIW